MKFIAAHKVMLMVGLVLAGGVAWYLHRKNSSTAASGSLSPDYGGVATSPYSDSAAPQFSFDLGSLLPQGQTTPPSGSSAPPPAGGPNPSGAPPGASPGPITTEPIHWPGGSGTWVPITGIPGTSTPLAENPTLNPPGSEQVPVGGPNYTGPGVFGTGAPATVSLPLLNTPLVPQSSYVRPPVGSAVAA